MSSRNKSKHRNGPEKTSAHFSSEPIEIQIDRLSFGSGAGVGRHQGKVVFVPFTAPGDTIKAKVTNDKSNFSDAELLEVLKPSSKRIDPACEVFGQCGGCQWQHVNYDTQLEEKLAAVQKIFSQNKLEVQSWKNTISSPQIWNYRNRIQLHSTGKSFGYHARGSNRLVEIKKCPIAEEPINDFIRSNTLPAGRVELSLDKNLKVHYRTADDELGSHDFSQVNRFQNEKLISSVLEHLSQFKPQKFLDLYAGSGNFTFPIFESLKNVSFRAVEYSENSVRAANESLRAQNLSPNKISFYCADVAVFLKRQRISAEEFVLLDPPRAGCSNEVIERLASSGLKNAIYISCDPTTLARDLKKWQQINPKMQITSVQVFDMFPQTYHLETMVCLSVDS